MPRGGANFSSEELVRVLSHYDVGIVHRVKPLTAGNRRAPKVIIIADKGSFLLKRRPRGRDDLDRVALAHAVQKHLAGRSFPVTSLLPTIDEHATALNIDNHIYEFFEFVAGARYDASKEATREAGRQLAVFHKAMTDFGGQTEPSQGCFHDSATVRRHLKLISVDRRTAPARQMQAVAADLLLRYDKSAVRVNAFGFRNWKRQIIHGDWHPGNLLFRDRRIVAVVDFDSIRVSPSVTDLANGMLQFSIVGDRPNPADWPAYFDEARLFEFLHGYREVVKLSKRKLYSLVDLMIETMIAEAVLPVAATGFFGDLSGLDFLRMILRKTQWLRRHRKDLTDTILGAP
jgi:Ser/Thr protein kinase RdoA (MazF antagonist)